MKTKYVTPNIEITEAENVLTTSPEVETDKVPFVISDTGNLSEFYEFG